MIHLRNLIDFFPYYFKEQDTYKVDGRGILERFLEICGEYFQDNITTDIDNTLDLIDLDHTPEYCLNYIWELLGELPFAYGNSIDKAKFDKHYNGLLPASELNALKNTWTLPKQGPVVLSETEVRNLLRYAVSLIKIRGTKQFFEIMFRVYGFSVEISDPTEAHTLSDGSCSSIYTKRPLSENKYDEALFDSSKHTSDINSGCKQCIPINVNIVTNPSVLPEGDAFRDKYGEYFRDSLSVIFSGRYSGLLPLHGLSLDELISTWHQIKEDQDANSWMYGDKVIRYYSTDQDDWVNNNAPLILSGDIPASIRDFAMFRNIVESFFDKYLPYNVKAYFTYNGVAVDDGITLYAEFADSTNTTIDLVKHPEGVPIKVSIRSNWARTEQEYQVCSEYTPYPSEEPELFYFKTWGDPHNVTETFYITKPGVYYFKQVSGTAQTVEDVDGTTTLDTKYKKIVVTQPMEEVRYELQLRSQNALPNSSVGTDSIGPIDINDISIKLGYLTPENWLTTLGYHQWLFGTIQLDLLCTKTVVTKEAFRAMDGTTSYRNLNTVSTYVPLYCDTATNSVFQQGNTMITLKGAFPVYGKRGEVTHRVYVKEFKSFYRDFTIYTDPLVVNLTVTPQEARLINGVASAVIGLETNYDNSMVPGYFDFPTYVALCTANNQTYENGDTFETHYIGTYKFIPQNDHGSDFSDFEPVTFSVDNFLNSQYGLTVSPLSVKLGREISIRVYTKVQGDDELNYNVNIYEANQLMATIQAKNTTMYTPTTRGVLKVECVGDPSVFVEVTVLPPPSEDTKTGLYIEEADGAEQYGVSWLERGSIDAINSNRVIVSRCKIIDCREDPNDTHNFPHIMFEELGFNPFDSVPSVPRGYSIYNWEDSEGTANLKTYNQDQDVRLNREPAFRYAHSETLEQSWADIIAASPTAYGNLDIINHLSIEYGYYAVLSRRGTERDINNEEPYYLAVGPAFKIRSYNNSKNFTDNGKIVTVRRWYKNSQSEWVYQLLDNKAYTSVADNSRYVSWAISTQEGNTGLCCIPENRAFDGLDGPFNGVCMYEFITTMANQQTYRAILFIYNKDYIGLYNERYDITNQTIIE